MDKVGWVEAAAETHHIPKTLAMGFALLYPSYALVSGWVEHIFIFITHLTVSLPFYILAPLLLHHQNLEIMLRLKLQT